MTVALFSHYRYGVVDLEGGFVRAFARKCIEHVGDSRDAALYGNLILCKLTRITGSVPAFVVRERDRVPRVEEGLSPIPPRSRCRSRGACAFRPSPQA